MRALLVTHGRLGEVLVDSARAVALEEAPIEAMSNDAASAAAIRAGVEEWLGREEGPCLILVDVGGGSCGTAARLAVGDRRDVWILGGVNLPMVLTFVSSYANLAPQELVTKMLDRALNAVGLLGSHR